MSSGKFKGAALTALPATVALSFTIASAATVIHVPAASSAARPNVAARPNIVGGTYISGGATLPAIAYDGGVASGGNANLGTNLTAPAGTVLKYWGQPFSYCQTGSGFGKKVLDGTVAANASACVAPPGSAAGFTTAAQTFADFVGSDSPVSNTEYSTFLTDAAPSGKNIIGRVAPVQVPYIAGSIALFYRNSSLANQTVVLSPATVCGIASGQITNWNQIPVNPANPTGTKYGAKTLTFVVRADSSGTSFSFSNYLSGAGVCSQTFGLNTVYADNDTTVSPPPTTQILPTSASDATFLAGNGNPTVIDVILGTVAGTKPNGGGTEIAPDGAIGYVEAANAKANVKAAAGINFANIGTTTPGKSPIADLPAAANTITAVKAGYVLSPFVNNGRPASDIETLAAAGITPPNFPGTTTSTGPCLAIVDPKSYDNPTAGYPIIAVSNLEFSAVGNGTTGSSHLQTLAGYLDSNSNVGTGKITSVDASNAATGTTGYSTLGKLGASSSETTAIKCIHA